MFVQIAGYRSARRHAAYLTIIAVGGCGTNISSESGALPRTTLSLSTLGVGDQSTFVESDPNDEIFSAELVEVGSAARVIRGRISSGRDVDVYDLGPVQRGDRILVTMTADPSLDGAISLFDENGVALLVNDHRNVYLGRSEPFIDVISRGAEESCYVAVAATPGYSSLGDYGLVASKTSDSSLPETRPDVMLLVFSGGQGVRIGGRNPVNVPVFDAANIDGKYAGRTDEMIGHILAGVRNDYASLDVTILSTSEGGTYDGTMTRLFFGTYDPALLGVAEGIDEFNATPAQDAIVFTDTFAAFMLLDPSVEEMGTAIANVTSHEAGHLLGLVHTGDKLGIMDVTASLNDLLRDQDFRLSPIYGDVFPIGSQDAVQSLLDTVGGDGLLPRLKQIAKDTDTARYRSESWEPPARDGFYLSTCGINEH